MTRLEAFAAAILAAALLAAPVAAEPGGQSKGGKSAAAHADRKPGKMTGKDHTKAKATGPTAAGHRPADRRAAVATSDRHVVRTVRVDDFFDRDDEALIRRYYGTSVACPPGLAAKNNGCLPPGQAKKTYGVGTILPRGLDLAPLPRDLLGRLPLAPDGYYYGRYNGDVYLVENATRRIVDTIIFNLLR